MTDPRRDLLDRLVAEQHNGGGWKTPPPEWNAAMSTASRVPVEFPGDDDLTRARRLREAVAEWDAAHEAAS